MRFYEKIEAIQEKHNSLVCVGLDSDVRKLPQKFVNQEYPQFAFNKWIIDQTWDVVSAYKPNVAFYEARGVQGWIELQMTMDYLTQHHSEIVTIADAKRADIGSTNEGYAAAIFDEIGFDSITLHPYLGKEALEPFLSRDDKGCIILCRTSNPGAGELQDLLVDGRPLWEIVAEKVSTQWNKKNNCALVVGATYPEEMKRVRAVVGDMPFLVPGIGVQGGDVEAVVRAGKNSNGGGMIINSARGIIFAANPRVEAIVLRDEINKYR
jgi:orotidine-5'-phosphate decarboxylase